MAALAACEIDNILVELRGAELPAMDGSALPFVRLMECAGTVEQSQPVATLEVAAADRGRLGSGFARLEPAGELALSLRGRRCRRPARLPSRLAGSLQARAGERARATTGVERRL